MRITKDTLLKLARQTVQQRMQNDRDIIAAYLTGSLLGDDPLLGGAGDIDLVFVHRNAPLASREIVRMSNEIHLDLAHRKKADYVPPRELRTRPRLGFEMYDPQLIQETEHFFEFTQASVRAGFDDPFNQMFRAYTFLRASREKWMGLQFAAQAPGPGEIGEYLSAVEDVANAIAVLGGSPLTDRRFLLTLQSRTETLGRSGLFAGLMGLIGGPSFDPALLPGWLPLWEAAFLAGGATHRYDMRIHTARLEYYRHGCTALAAGTTPQAALWPLLQTWTLAIQSLSDSDPRHEGWLSACTRLGLAGEAFAERLDGLDLFLDTVEELLETLTAQNGLEPF